MASSVVVARVEGPSRRVRLAYRPAVVAVAALVMVATVLVGAARGDTLDCGDVVTTDTVLSADVGPCQGVGLIVAADGITLDLGGHTVSGDAHARSRLEPGPNSTRDQAGIVLRRVTGVTVTNGTVEGFDAGVAIMGGGDNTVRRVTAQGNVNYRLVTGADGRPQDVDSQHGPFCLFGEGVTAFNSDGNVIEHNVVVGNGPFGGITLVGDSDGNVVSRNDVRDNDLLNETPDGDTTICGGIGVPHQPMTAGRHVQGIGVRVEGPGAEHNVVEHNRIVRSGLAGIMVHGHHTRFGVPNSHNVLRKNRIFDTGRVGHDLDRQAHGILLHHSGASVVNAPHSTLIEGNTSSHNFGGGIFLDSRGGMHSTVVRDNVVIGNGLDGLHVAGPGDPRGAANLLVGNRGHGNGVRAEEVNEQFAPYANYAGTDGADMSDGCVRNDWRRNHFGSVNQTCVATGGTGRVGGPGQSGSSEGAGVGPLGRGNPNG